MSGGIQLIWRRPRQAQRYGEPARQNLARLRTFQKEDLVKWGKQAKYRRIIGKVWAQPESFPKWPKTLDVNLLQSYHRAGLVVP